MRLSKQQSKIVQAYAHTAVGHFLKTYKLDSSIAATRVACEVLSKFHFDVKPIPVVVQIYNEEYVKKGKVPDSVEELEEWKKEGARAILLNEYLVPVINDKTLIDLSISQMVRAEELVVPPIICDTFEEFLTGQNNLYVNNGTCVTIYEALPEDKKYLSNKDWFDKTHTRDIVKEIYSDVRGLLR